MVGSVFPPCALMGLLKKGSDLSGPFWGLGRAGEGWAKKTNFSRNYDMGIDFK